VTLTARRMLVMFSVALNIGFVIMAAILIYKHPPPHHDFFDMQVKILSSLNVPAQVKQSVLDALTAMEKSHEAHVDKLHQARHDAMTLLATPGPLDLKRFDAIDASIAEILIQRSHMVHDHLIDIRKQLGDEKGAEYFSAMMKAVEKRRTKEHP